MFVTLKLLSITFTNNLLYNEAYFTSVSTGDNPREGPSRRRSLGLDIRPLPWLASAALLHSGPMPADFVFFAIPENIHKYAPGLFLFH